MANGEKPIMVLLAGDDELNESKLLAELGGAYRPAHPDEIRDIFGCEAGFLGPVKAPEMLLIADRRLEGGRNRITGANQDHYHITGVNVGHHFQPDRFADIRTVKSGEGCPLCKGSLRVTGAIEIGHIFKLGTKYSLAMGANVLDDSGREQPIVMGSYGIGIDRILACAIEMGHDDNGICWPQTLAPYDAELIAVNIKDGKVQKHAEILYQTLQSSGFEVLFDDRDERPGVKFKDADLLGIPYQIVVSPKTIADNCVEVKERSSGLRSLVNIDELPAILRGHHE